MTLEEKIQAKDCQMLQVFMQNLYFVSLPFRFDQKFGCVFCMFIVLSLGASVQQKPRCIHM